MKDIPLDLEQLGRQASQHLEALRLAGVQWLPGAPPLMLAVPVPTPAQAVALDTEGSLFEETDAMTTAGSFQEKLTLQQRRTELEVLAKKVSACTRCAALASTRTQTVFADGTIPVELCFIGEAPGADEDKEGKPFVGAAGQLLNKIIAACGLKREEVYICNIIKCRPPGNATPTPEWTGNCSEFLTRQLELVRPKFICALGGCAAQNLLGTTKPMGQLRGRFHEYRGIPVLCTYHPAYLLPHRSPGSKALVWEDMKMLLKRMGRPIPTKDQG